MREKKKNTNQQRNKKTPSKTTKKSKGSNNTSNVYYDLPACLCFSVSEGPDSARVIMFTKQQLLESGIYLSCWQAVL